METETTQPVEIIIHEDHLTIEVHAELMHPYYGKVDTLISEFLKEKRLRKVKFICVDLSRLDQVNLLTILILKNLARHCEGLIDQKPVLIYNSGRSLNDLKIFFLDKMYDLADVKHLEVCAERPAC